MPTTDQFSNMIKPVKKTRNLNVHIDKEKIAFIKQRINFITDKLGDKCRNIGSLGSQINKLSKKRNDNISVPYASHKEGEIHGFGRLKPKKTNDTAYVQMTRPVRQFLTRDFCTDIDIKNCHPVIMEQLYHMYYGEPNKDLIHWNENRERYFQLAIDKSKLKEGITRDDAKSLAFVYMYEGSVDKRFTELGLDKNDILLKPMHKLISQLCASSKKLAENIKNNNPEIWNDIPTDKKGARVRASKFSSLMQHIEKRSILIMDDIAKNMKLRVHDYCHDGLLVSTDTLEPLSLELQKKYCDLCMKTISNDLGFTFEIIGKAMDNKFADKLDKFYFSYRDVDNEIENDLEAVKKFKQVYNGRLVICGGDWYIRPTGTFFWRTGEHAVRKAIADCMFYKMVSDKKTPYGLNYSGISNIYKVLTSDIDDINDDNFITDLNISLRGKVYWEDKHFNVETGVMKKNIVTDKLAPIIYINRPAPDFTLFNKDCEPMRMLNSVLQGLTDIQRIEYYQIIGRMASGYVTDKQWLVLNGSRNTSKSTINNVVSRSFGEYVTSVNPPFSQRYDTDSAAKNRWIKTCNCHLKRIAIGAEKDTTVDRDGNILTPVLDGNVIKKVIANGFNDDVITRGHCQNEEQLRVNVAFLFSFNGLPEANPRDALETMIPLSLDIKFTDDINDLEKYPELFMKRNQAIADYICLEEVQDCFVWCCLKEYYVHEKFQPQLHSMSEELTEIRGEAGEVTTLTLYNNICVLDGQVDCKVLLEAFRVGLGEPLFTQNKLTRFLKKMGKNKMKGRSGSYYKDLSLRDVELDECVV